MKSSEKMNNDISFISETMKMIAIGDCSIALAGSRAYGGADEDSDIDIYMLVDDGKLVKITEITYKDKAGSRVLNNNASTD